ELRHAQVQERAEHFIRVLAESGRIVVNAAGRLGQMNPRRQQCGWAGARVIAFNECLSRFNMRVFEHFGSGQDGRAEVVQVAQAIPEFPTLLPVKYSCIELIMNPRTASCIETTTFWPSPLRSRA